METVSDVALEVKRSQRFLAAANGAVRRGALLSMAGAVEASAGAILAANREDVASASGLDAAQLDRLRLNEARIEQMAGGVRGVAAQEDVVGAVVDGWVLGNGVRVKRVRVPLGVIGVIYENRPNVTADASALALYAGNGIVLRGSSSAIHSNRAIVAAIRQGIAAAGLPSGAVGLIEDTSREAAREFMRLDGVIDCLIPRGGKALLAAVRESATVPTIIDGDGNCHIYLDRSADMEKALPIVVNAKTQRPGVCNAVETVLVPADIANEAVPLLAGVLSGVEIRGDKQVLELIPGRATLASEADWATEFLSLVLAVRVVDSLDQAIEHIGRYGTGHSEAIITEDFGAANRFVRDVDAAAVLVNASTRFVDGGQLGMGAEIGISTQKLHARGPLGVEQLTSVKFVIEGEGQVRS